MTREQRHRCMSRIRGRDTKPELVVRHWLWHQGFRYRLYVKALPGRPDIVMRKWRTVIFVNGCFWHGHECQRHRPVTNAQFWQDKITRNRERDERNQALLKAAGWNVIVVWECQLSPKKRAETLHELDVALSRIVLERNGAMARPYRMPAEDAEMPMAAEPESGYDRASNDRNKEEQPT